MSADGSKKAGTILGALGVVGLLALKFKAYLLVAFKGASLIKLAWLFKSFISMFLTIGIYAMLLGWQYAVMIVLLILIHEMGHFIWMKALGLNPQMPMFVPFVGAYVAMTKLPPDQATHAWVSIAGPLVGGLGCAVFYWAGLHMNNLFLMAAGSTGFLLNLIQLVPAKPLDGGFIIQSLSKWLLIPGTALLFALGIFWHSILLLVISVLSMFSLLHQLTAKKEGPAYADMALSKEEEKGPEPKASYELTPPTPVQKVLIGIAYVSLTGMLGYLYWLSHAETVSMLPAKERASLMRHNSSRQESKPTSQAQADQSAGEKVEEQ